MNYFHDLINFFDHGKTFCTLIRTHFPPEKLLAYTSHWLAGYASQLRAFTYLLEESLYHEDTWSLYYVDERLVIHKLSVSDFEELKTIFPSEFNKAADASLTDLEKIKTLTGHNHLLVPATLQAYKSELSKNMLYVEGTLYLAMMIAKTILDSHFTLDEKQVTEEIDFQFAAYLDNNNMLPDRNAVVHGVCQLTTCMARALNLTGYIKMAAGLSKKLPSVHRIPIKSPFHQTGVLFTTDRKELYRTLDHYFLPNRSLMLIYLKSILLFHPVKYLIMVSSKLKQCWQKSGRLISRCHQSTCSNS